jgi:hypothetical protein
LSEFDNLITKAKETDWVDPKIAPANMGISRIVLHDSLIEQSNILSIFAKNFTVALSGLYRFPSYSFYDWHTDNTKISGSRTCVINTVIRDDESLLLLQNGIHNQLTKKFIKIKYPPGELYVLDVSNPHALIAFEEPRYILSMRIIAPSYIDVVQFCKDNNL